MESDVAAIREAMSRQDRIKRLTDRAQPPAGREPAHRLNTDLAVELSLAEASQIMSQ